MDDIELPGADANRAHDRSVPGKTPAGSVQSAVAPPALIQLGAGGVPPPGSHAAGGVPATHPPHSYYQPDSPWNEAMDARLVAMWHEGLSAAAIGRELGLSKGSVISRKRRLPELDARPSPIKAGGRVKPKRKPAPIKLDLPSRPAAPKLPWFGVTWKGTPDTYEGPPPMWRPHAGNALPIPRGAIGPSRTCRWTDCNRAPWLFCDAPSVANKSWCEAHNAIVFRPAE